MAGFEQLGWAATAGLCLARIPPGADGFSATVLPQSLRDKWRALRRDTSLPPAVGGSNRRVEGPLFV